LETGKFYRVGGEALQESDARIVSATNRDVATLVEEKKFREDLFYRLNVVPIEIPPLRARRNDIPLLVEHFLTHFCARHNRTTKRISDEAIQVLCASNWPGNVRQLRNLIERLVVTVNSDIVQVNDLPLEIPKETTAKGAALMSLADATEIAEKATIQAALVARNFHREQTARALGISLRTLHYKMSRYSMH
jgi:two-component system NtrC family response regulator